MDVLFYVWMWMFYIFFVFYMKEIGDISLERVFKRLVI